jgi:hypothetical protein
MMTLAICAMLLALGCAPESLPGVPGSLLRAHFPHHADRVLGVGGPALVTAPDGRGFVPAPPEALDPVKAAEAALAQRRGLRAVFPSRGDEAVRMTLADGFAIEVREVGLTGLGRIERGAVVYERGGGGEASFWSATAGGYEEWLVVRASTSSVAIWEVTGATLRQRREAVEVVDGTGVPRLIVTAPTAFSQSGAAMRVRLRVEGGRLALHCTGAPAAGFVLVDPLWQTTGAMRSARAWHTATRLLSGKVLVAGGATMGYSHAGVIVGTMDSAELYDPGPGTFAPAGSLATSRYNHVAALLP